MKSLLAMFASAALFSLLRAPSTIHCVAAEPDPTGAAHEAAANGLLVAATGDLLFDVYRWLLAENFKDAATLQGQVILNNLHGDFADFNQYRGGTAQLPAFLDEPMLPGSSDLRILPDEQLDLLEPQFGDDPRYWQLRWWNARLRADGIGPAGTVLEPADWLRRGVERGARDAAGDWLLLQAERANRRREIGAQLEALAGATPRERASAYERQHAAELDALTELVERYPELSWFYYERAHLRMEWGDFEGGVEDLAAGNAAPLNAQPQPFPWSAVQARLAQQQEPAAAMDLEGEYLDMGAPVDGLIVSAARTLPEPNYIYIKEHAKELQARLALGADFGELKTWHQYICRLGQMEGSSVIQWLVAVVLHNMVVHGALLYGPQLTNEQAAGLYMLNNRAASIRTRLINIADDEQASLRRGLERALAQQGIGSFELAGALLQLQVPGLASTNYGFSAWQAYDERSPGTEPPLTVTVAHLVVSVTYFEWARERERLVKAGTFTTLQTRWQELAAYDFDTLSWPEGMPE
jgi:hypothetical protein